MVDVDEAGGEAVARDIRKRGGNASFVACDVTDARRVRPAFDRILAEAERLDILVNSAGGFWKQLSVEETWCREIQRPSQRSQCVRSAAGMRRGGP